MQTKSSDATRVYLAVPFAEKEEAKQHGARWSPERRQWWIERHDIDKHPGIHRWIVDDDALAAGKGEVLAFSESTPGRDRRNATRSGPVHTLATTFDLPVCACSTAPWEHCEHTMTQS